MPRLGQGNLRAAPDAADRRLRDHRKFDGIPLCHQTGYISESSKGGTEGLRPIAATGEAEMKAAGTKATETKCPACNGTGYPVVMQPVQPGRKIYPAPCKKCGGKGRITEPAK